VRRLANPTGVAVAVRIGELSEVPPENIEIVVRRDFNAAGITNLAFFFEKGGNERSTIIYATRNHVEGPHSLGAGLDVINKFAAQHRFEIKRGLN